MLPLANLPAVTSVADRADATASSSQARVVASLAQRDWVSAAASAVSNDKAAPDAKAPAFVQAWPALVPANGVQRCGVAISELPPEQQSVIWLSLAKVDANAAWQGTKDMVATDGLSWHIRVSALVQLVPLMDHPEERLDALLAEVRPLRLQGSSGYTEQDYADMLALDVADGYVQCGAFAKASNIIDGLQVNMRMMGESLLTPVIVERLAALGRMAEAEDALSRIADEPTALSARIALVFYRDGATQAKALVDEAIRAGLEPSSLAMLSGAEYTDYELAQEADGLDDLEAIDKLAQNMIEPENRARVLAIAKYRLGSAGETAAFIQSLAPGVPRDFAFENAVERALDRGRVEDAERFLALMPPGRNVDFCIGKIAQKCTELGRLNEAQRYLVRLPARERSYWRLSVFKGLYEHGRKKEAWGLLKQPSMTDVQP